MTIGSKIQDSSSQVSFLRVQFILSEWENWLNEDSLLAKGT